MEQKRGILIADLSGYTAMTDAHGARSAANMVKRFLELINQSLAGHSRLVERIGDEVIIISDEVEDLVRTALRLQAFSQLEADFLAVHVGIHYGEILEEDHHFYGSTINLASRIATHSAGGQILCSAAALSRLDDHSSQHFKSIGLLKFKNVKEPVEVFEVVYRKDEGEKVFDPVCHMAVAPDRAAGAFRYGGNTYFFCSRACLNSFSENPALFVN